MAAARARDLADDDVRPRSDIYVGLLVISLIAMITGAVFLYLDWSQYPSTPPPKVEALPPRPSPPPAPGPGGQTP